MSDPYESPGALAGKVEWEGGLASAIFDYGISPEDLPAGTPEEVRAAWVTVCKCRPAINIIENWLATVPTEEPDDEPE